VGLVLPRLPTVGEITGVPGRDPGRKEFSFPLRALMGVPGLDKAGG
jgi:hypothetical protein